MTRTSLAVGSCLFCLASLPRLQAQEEVPVAPPSTVPPTATSPPQKAPTPYPAGFDLSTPEATLRSFVAVLNRNDLRGATTCIQGALPTTRGMDELQKRAQTQKASFRASNVKTIINGDRAMVTLDFSVLPVGANQAQNSSSKLKMVRAQGAWRIVAGPANVVTSYAGSDQLFFMATLIRNPDAAQKGAHEVMCYRNMESLFVAYIRYYDAHNGAPLNSGGFKKALMPFLKSEATLHCPDDATGQVSYRYNSGSENVGTVRETNLSRVVLFYEGQNGKLDSRHDGIAHIVTADGGVRRVNRQQAQNLLWKRQRAQ